MKAIRYSFIFISIISFCTSGLLGQGHRLSVSVPDLPGKDVILSHRLGMKFYTDDTVKTDEKGFAVFEGAGQLPGGMYQLVFPEKKFVEFFVDKNQSFTISTRISALTDSLHFTGSTENTRFLEWQQKYAINRIRVTFIQTRLKQGNLSQDSTQLLNQELKQIQTSNVNLWDSAIKDLKGTLAGKFLTGLKPLSIPETLGNQGEKENRARQYQYLKDHFFDGVDFNDERLLNTPVIDTKLDQYFKQIVPPIADSIAKEADRIIEKSRSGKNMYQYVVQFLFNLYSLPEIMGTDAVYVHIAEKYYLAGQTPWIDSANLRGIGTRVNELKPVLIGKVAPAMEGLMTPGDQPIDFKNIKSKFLILYFWSPDCSFCKESTPKFIAQYADLKQMGVEILAINTRTDKVEWNQFIADHNLNWINLYSPVNIRDIIEKYQAFSTPTMYILDAGRHIIAKSISYDQAKPFLTRYIADHK